MPKYHFRHPSLDGVEKNDLLKICKKDDGASYFATVLYDGRFNLQEGSLNQFRYWEGDKDPTASTVLFEVSVFGRGSQKFILPQIRSPDQFNALHLVGEEGIDHLENTMTEHRLGIRADMTYLDPEQRYLFKGDVYRLAQDASRCIEIAEDNLRGWEKKDMFAYLVNVVTNLEPDFLYEETEWVEKVGNLAKSEVNFASLTRNVSVELRMGVPFFELARSEFSNNTIKQKISYSDNSLDSIERFREMHQQTTKIIDSANEMISSSDVLRFCCEKYWPISYVKANYRVNKIIRNCEMRIDEMSKKTSSGEELDARDKRDVRIMGLAEMTRAYLALLPEKLRPSKLTKQELRLLEKNFGFSPLTNNEIEIN